MLTDLKLYKSGMYPFPSDDISVSEKNKEWAKKWGEAIYSAWINDRTGGIPYSGLEEFAELRRYGQGNQNIDQYKKILLNDSKDGTGKKEGYLNVNWEVFSVIPKFRHVVIGMMENQEHSIVATAVDPKSAKLREELEFKTWFRSRYKNELATLEKSLGINKTNKFIPETPEEMELYKIVGGFKLATEAEMEEAVDYTEYISDWKEVKRNLIGDLFDLGSCCTKDYVDQYTKKVKARYVDPINFIIQFSRAANYKNSEFAGEVVRETISNVRKVTGLSETELREIAQKNNGLYGNPVLNEWIDTNLDLGNGRWKYDDFLVEVLDFEFKSIDKHYKTRRKDSRGEEKIYDEKFGKVYDTEKRKTSVQSIQMVYKAKWIIGSDYIYEFGPQNDINRIEKKEVALSYNYYKISGRSKMSVARPSVDAFQLTWIKLQNAIAMASNSGISVEFTSLMNMKVGGDKMTPLDILSIRRDTGDLIWKATTHKGYSNTNQKPIQELKGGIGPMLAEFISIFQLNLEFIRDLTGINRVADASSPDPEQSVTGSEIAVAATNNALRPLYSAYISVKERCARNYILKLKALVAYNKEAYEGYLPILGSTGVKLMSLGADAADADYFIKIEAKPTEKMKETIRQASLAAMNPGKDGFVGIEMPEYLFINRMLDNGNLKTAEMYLNYRSQKNKDRQLKVQKENMAEGGKVANETAKVKGEEARKQKKTESDLKIEQDTNKLNLEDRNNENEHQRKMKEIALEATLDGVKEKSKEKVPA